MTDERHTASRAEPPAEALAGAADDCERRNETAYKRQPAEPPSLAEALASPPSLADAAELALEWLPDLMDRLDLVQEHYTGKAPGNSTARKRTAAVCDTLVVALAAEDARRERMAELIEAAGRVVLRGSGTRLESALARCEVGS